MTEERFERPANAPPHLFRPEATYFISAKTLHGHPFIAAPARRQAVADALHFACERAGWRLLAWIVLSNHYHCLLEAPEDASGLTSLIGSVHRYTATQWNREDGTPGRAVWHRFWDTCVTHEQSFYARLNYIHHNAVKHGVSPTAATYPFSSYAEWQARGDLRFLEGAYPWDQLDLEQ